MDALHIVCPECNGVNRLPAARLADHGKCGRCANPLFTAHPVALNENTFVKHTTRNDIPVVVDFWASWCGPCRQMAPVFTEAAALLEPNVRLAKVDTEAEKNLAARFGIKGIPTLVIFNHGREVARQSGAMAKEQLVGWIRANS